MFPRPGDLPNPGIELVSPTAPAVAGKFFTTEPPGKPHILRPHGLQPTRLCPGNSLGNNTGVGSHSVLQGIFPTQGSNLGLLHCGQILYCLSHQGSPCIHFGLVYFTFMRFVHEGTCNNSVFILIEYYMIYLSIIDDFGVAFHLGLL